MMEHASSSKTNPMLAPVSSTTTATTSTRISAAAVVSTHARVRRREEETATATATESAASTVIVHVEAPPGLLGFSLAPTSTIPPGMLIKGIQDTCVIKDRIRIGDQLLSVDAESIPTATTRSTLLQEVVQLIHRKRSNPIRTFTFKRTTSSSSNNSSSNNNKRKHATNKDPIREGTTATQHSHNSRSKGSDGSTADREQQQQQQQQQQHRVCTARAAESTTTTTTNATAAHPARTVSPAAAPVLVVLTTPSTENHDEASRSHPAASSTAVEKTTTRDAATAAMASTTILTARLEGQPQPQLQQQQQQQHDMERQHHNQTLFLKEKPVVKGTTGNRGKENRKDGSDESASDNFHCTGPPPAVAAPPAAASYQWNGPEHAAFMHGLHCCRSESWYTSMIRQYENLWSILSSKFVPTKTVLELQWYAYMSFIGKFYGWNIHHDHYWTLQQYTVLIETMRQRLHWHTLITYQDKIRQQTFQSNLVRDQQQQQQQLGAPTSHPGKENVTTAAMKNYRASPSAILIDATVVPNADNNTALAGRRDRTRPPPTPSKTTTRNLDATVLPNVDTAIASHDRTRPPTTSTMTRERGAKKKHATTTVARCGTNANPAAAAVTAKVKACQAERDLAALSQAVAHAEAAAELIANEAAAKAREKKKARRI